MHNCTSSVNSCPFECSWDPDCELTRAELLNWNIFNAYVWGIIVAFSLLDFAVLCLLAYIIFASNYRFSLNVQTGSYLFLLAAFSEKITYYCLDPGSFKMMFPPWLNRLLQYIFFPLLFTAYSLVLYFWAASYFRASTGRADVLRRLRLVFLAINVTIYSVEVGVTVAQYFLTSEENWQKQVVLYQIYLTFNLLMISSAFLFYGMRIYSQLRKFTSISHDGLRALRTVTLLTSATAVCFVSGVLFNLIVLLATDSGSTMFIVSDIITQFLCFVASVLILVLLGRPRKTRPPRQTQKPNDTTPFFSRHRSNSDLSESETFMPE